MGDGQGRQSRLPGWSVPLRQRRPGEASSKLDFLLLDGLSQDVIAQEGSPLVPFPPGSILKPTFFASVPGLMAERPAGTGRDVQDPETLDVPTRRPGEPEKSPLQR